MYLGGSEQLVGRDMVTMVMEHVEDQQALRREPLPVHTNQAAYFLSAKIKSAITFDGLVADLYLEILE